MIFFSSLFVRFKSKKYCLFLTFFFNVCKMQVNGWMKKKREREKPRKICPSFKLIFPYSFNGFTTQFFLPLLRHYTVCTFSSFNKKKEKKVAAIKKKFENLKEIATIRSSGLLLRLYSVLNFDVSGCANFCTVVFFFSH